MSESTMAMDAGAPMNRGCDRKRWPLHEQDNEFQTDPTETPDDARSAHGIHSRHSKTQTPSSERLGILSAYEVLRAKNIERNQKHLASLGLVTATDAQKVIDAAWKKNSPDDYDYNCHKKKSSKKRTFRRVQCDSRSNASLPVRRSGKAMTRSGSRSITGREGNMLATGTRSTSNVDSCSSALLSDLEGTWV